MISHMPHSLDILAQINAEKPLEPLAPDAIRDMETALIIIEKSMPFSQPVEARVEESAQKVYTVLPNLDLQDAEYLGKWIGHEKGHGNWQLDLLNECGLEPVPPPDE